MSLYVGHLSPHVIPEDLLRVFQRFGPCRIQLKDGYGFAVYEARADAEKALRNLKGTFIRGKPISLTWSNRQPRHVQRPARVSRVYEPFHRRISREENDRVGNQSDPKASSANASPNILERNHLEEVTVKADGQLSEDIVDIEGDKDTNLQEAVNGNVTSDVNHLRSDRWGQPGSDSLNGHGIDNVNDFDRYEPYRGYKDDDEKINMNNSYGSRERGRSREKRWRNDSDYDTGRNFEMSKPHPSCYNCGQVGHIIRNCPEANVQRDKFSKINRKIEELDVRERGRLKRPRYSSGAQLDVKSMRHIRDRKESHSGKFGRLSRTKSLPECKENRSIQKVDSQSKKRNKVRNKASKRSVRKGRARRSNTSSRSSESRASISNSHSKSPRAVSASSSSRSRSGSLCSRSASSSSRSVSKSSHSKSLRSRSRSKTRSPSRSSSRSFSLPVSLEPKPCSLRNNRTGTSMVSSPRNNVEMKRLELVDKKVKCACLNAEDNPSISLEVENKKNVEQSVHGGDDDGAQSSPYSVDYKENIDFKESISLSDLPKDVSTALMNREQNSKQVEYPLSKSEKQVPTNSGTHGSTSITCQEIFSALRHYGLGTPEEGQTVFGVEDYLGSSRLWPWEIIYYRRLKKGPISIENYARRLQQNKEFCIVDKYVRSSSGWGELN